MATRLSTQASLSPLVALALAGLAGCQEPQVAPSGLASDDDTTALRLAEGFVAPIADDRGVMLADLQPKRVQHDELGGASVRLAQHLDGVPVFGGEAFVHMNEAGEVETVKDYLKADLAVDTTPSLSMDEGVAVALSRFGRDGLTSPPEAELVVLRRDGQDHLTWKVQLRRTLGFEDPSAPIYFIDAHTGEQVWQLEGMRTAAGTGTAYYEGSVAIKIYKPSGDTYYYLEDPARDLGTFDMNNSWTSADYVYDSDVNFTSSDQQVAVQAHYAGEGVWDYYRYTHSYKGLDGSGGPGYIDSLSGTGTVISSFVNYGTGYANAYWDGSVMVFGGGDGVYFDNMATLDITGHEMTHAVTTAQAAFTYYSESGALDEGYADIFAAMVERYVEGDSSDVWEIGEDCSLYGSPVRDMKDPSSDGYTVDHYDDLYCDPADYCGVHTNMGIPILAYYLLSEGGNHPTYGGTTMTGIGEDSSEDIAWRALKVYLGSDSDMNDARNAWLDAASDLYGAGNNKYKQVMNAWSLVGVGVASSTSVCTGYTYPYSYELSSGSYKYYPKSAGAAYNAGTFKVKLEGDTAADFDIFLQQKDATTGVWSTVAKSKTSGSSTESFTYTATAGTYRMYVKAQSADGEYVACMTSPK